MTMDRPRFNEMMDELKLGHAAAVFVKDTATLLSSRGFGIFCKHLSTVLSSFLRFSGAATPGNRSIAQERERGNKKGGEKKRWTIL